MTTVSDIIDYLNQFPHDTVVFANEDTIAEGAEEFITLSSIPVEDFQPADEDEDDS